MKKKKHGKGAIGKKLPRGITIPREETGKLACLSSSHLTNGQGSELLLPQKRGLA